MRNIKTEPRECKDCGQTYDWNMRNIYGYCPPCRKRFYVKKQRLDQSGKRDYKKPYPLNTNEQRKRYRRIQNELKETFDREEWREVFNRELEYMQTSGILEWCTDLRTVIIQRPGSGKTGRKPHTDSKSTYPDTRGIYE